LRGQLFTVVPQLSVPAETQAHIIYVPFAKPAPTRRVVLAWRRSLTRYEAIAAFRNTLEACELKGVAQL
jgi:LysR family hydrogen peroxide-inducible transcriptional activator